MEMHKFLLLIALLFNNNALAYTGSNISNSTAKATGAATLRTLAAHLSDHINVKDFGAKCDGVELLDITTTSGQPTITSASYSFVSGDVGKKVYLYETTDNGTSTGRKMTSAEVTIISVASGVATLSANATVSATATGRMVMYTTDDTASIQAAINAMTPAYRGREGGIVEFPRGICVASAITLKRQVLLVGEGRDNTKILQLGNTNASFIVSENFATLTGTGANYGTNANVPSWFGLRDIAIDGNRAYQTAGNCIDFYGNAQIFERTMIANCYAVGRYTEAAATYAYNPTDWRAQEEGFFDDNIIRNVGTHGWQMRGPHDSTTGVELIYDWGYSGAGYGFINEASGSLYSGAGHFGQIHPYTSRGTLKTNLYLGAGSDYQKIYSDLGSTTIASGANIDDFSMLGCGYGATTPCLDFTTSGDYVKIGRFSGTWYSGTLPTGLTMINVPSGADGVQINVSASSISSSTANNTLLKVRGAFGRYTGVLSNTGGTANVCADLGGSYNSFDFSTFGCKTHTLYTSGGFHNMLTLNNYVGGGETALTGTFNSADIVKKGDTNNDNFSNNPAGAAAKPSLTFGGNLTTGMFGTSTTVNASVAGAEVGKWTAAGIQLTGTAPSVASGAGDCGTSPTIVGNNQVGKVTVGSGTNGGVCTLTFAGGYTFANPPVCQVADITTPANVLKAVTTTTTLAITAATAITAGDVLSYQCIGYY